MAFTRPVAGTDISAADFGQPVFDMLTTQRSWVYLTGSLSSQSSYTLLPGSSSFPAVTVAHRWIILAFVVANSTGAAFPKATYQRFKINGTIVNQSQYKTTIASTGEPSIGIFATETPVIPTSAALELSMWGSDAGYVIWIDGGLV